MTNRICGKRYAIANAVAYRLLEVKMETRDILNYPSGLYVSGDLIIQRRVGCGFLIMEETHHGWIELRRYDENGLLAETMYEKA